MAQKTYSFGTLYLDDKPMAVSNYYEPDIPRFNGETITIGNTQQYKSLHWVQLGDTKTLVCAQTILKEVSWDDLRKAGFIEGKMVKIDGEIYRCRLLRAITPTSKTSELTQFIAEYGDDSRIVNSFDHMYWVEEEGLYFNAHVDGKLVQAPTTNWTHCIMGFRPVLEPASELGPDADKGYRPSIAGFYANYEYEKGTPLAFTQMIALTNNQKVQLLLEYDKLYADTEQDTTDWALEYQVTARMMLHEGWLPINPRHLNLVESLDRLRPILGVGNCQLLKIAATAYNEADLMAKYLESQA